ncbi:MAG: hypothetical protein FJX52_13295, partial [Alphaproteobacteria bacterium]|nr:hypothetical protein [Alphaproteobacteria bacterium]
MAKRPDPTISLPSKDELLRFIRESPVPVGKRDIARHFRLGAAHRAALKGLLKEIERDGAVERSRKRRFGRPGALP